MRRAAPCGRCRRGRSPPEACARRELEEEAGVRAGRLERLTSIWTTPGFTTETIHLFWAAQLTATQSAHERDEFIEVVPRPLSAVLDDIRRGEIRDAKSIAALLYLAGFVLGERNSAGRV